MCITDNVPLVDVDDENIDFGIYQSLEENMVNNIVVADRNPELANGRRVRQQIVESLFSN